MEAVERAGHGRIVASRLGENREYAERQNRVSRRQRRRCDARQFHGDGNTVRDIQLTFGTRADLQTLTFGSYTCDATVLVRGTSGIICPH